MVEVVDKNYNKSIEFINNEIDGNLEKDISKNLENLDYNLREKLGQIVVNLAFSGEQVYIRESVVTDYIINEGKDYIKQLLSEYKKLISKKCLDLHNNLLEVANSDIDKNKKFSDIDWYINDFNHSFNSLMEKLNSERFLFIEKLEDYIKSNIDNDEYRFELNEYFRREKKQLLDNIKNNINLTIKEIKKNIEKNVEDNIIGEINYQDNKIEENKIEPSSRLFEKNGHLMVESSYLFELETKNPLLLDSLRQIQLNLAVIDATTNDKQNSLRREALIGIEVNTNDIMKNIESIDLNEIDNFLGKVESIGSTGKEYISFIEKKIKEFQKNKTEEKQNESNAISSNTSINETKTEKTNTFDYSALAKKYANTDNFFNVEFKQFEQSIENIINKEVKFLFRHNLSMKLYTSWLDSKTEIEMYSDKVINNIAMLYQMKQENRILESNKLLDNFSAYIENYKQKDYANNEFSDAIEQIISSNSLNQEEIDVLRKLADEYKAKYNLFIQSKINEMYNKSLETVKRHFDIDYSKDSEEKITEINKPVVETPKEEVKEEKKNQIDDKPENNKRNFQEGAKQFIESIKSITNKDVHFLKKHELGVKLSDAWFKQVREIDEFSHKTLLPIAEMYQMKKESIIDDANLLLDNYSTFIQNCKQKDYSNGAFHSLVNEIINDNFSNQEEIDALLELADEYKKQYNVFIYSKIDVMYKDTLEKASRHFGISYLNEESEELKENKGHKI